MVVDDDTAILRLIEKRLTMRGFDVLVARDGRQAWSLLEAGEEPPDVVVTDLLMPEMDGAELVTHLRGSPQTAEVPVLVLTAVATNDPRLRDLRATPGCRVEDKTIAATRGALEAVIAELIGGPA